LSGQETADSRAECSSCSHFRCAAKPSSVSSEGSGSSGTCSRSHARTSARNSCSAPVKSRSIGGRPLHAPGIHAGQRVGAGLGVVRVREVVQAEGGVHADRKSTRLNSSHVKISYAVFCLKKKNR